jgi:hypothetical protein
VSYIIRVAVLVFFSAVFQSHQVYSIENWFKLTLSDITFKKETQQYDDKGNYIRSTFRSYPYSRTFSDLGIQGTFDEGQGLYEVYWSPPEDENHIKKELHIKVFFSSKYSPDRNIALVQCDYTQQTNDPQDPEDLGIHNWHIEAKDISYLRMSGNRLKFEEVGNWVDTHIDTYEKIDQGNPIFRSIERVEYNNPKSKLTIELDVGQDWFASAPDIYVTTREIDFGNWFVLTPDQDIDKNSVKKYIDIKNYGNEMLHIGDYDIVQGSSRYFSVLGPRCTDIPPDSKCQIKVRFTPAGPGPKTGQMYITSNDPDEGIIYIDLKAHCIFRSIRQCVDLLLLD